MLRLPFSVVFAAPVRIRLRFACVCAVLQLPLLLDAEEQRLFWVEGYDGEIWSCRADGSDVKTWQVGTEIGAMALRGKGGVVIV